MTTGAAMQWRDTSSGYGLVSRGFHWSMAALFAWQFATAIIHWVDEDAGIVDSLFWSHRSTGFVLLILVFLRGGWGIANLRDRPGHRADALGAAANLGHLALYALMILVPALALVRSYASGRGFTWVGIEIVVATGVELGWLREIANDLHGPLGWLLLVLIVGHGAMALVHHFVFRDGTLLRMARGRDGRKPSPPVRIDTDIEEFPH
jgi:cytochrome b561